MGQSIVDTERQLFALGKSMKGQIPVTTKSVAVNIALHKAIGPFYNIYRNLTATVKTMTGIMKNLATPLKAIGMVFGGMRDNLFFLIGIITLVAAGFVALAGELGGVGGIVDKFKESLSSLGITSDSIKEAFDLLIAGLQIGFDALVAGWSAVITNLSDLGIFDSIMGAFSGLLIGAQSAFDGVMEAIDILGLGGGDLSTSITDAIDFVFGFLEDVGFIEYFDQFMVTMGLLGEVWGAVFGGLIVWIAKIAKSATTEGTTLNKIASFMFSLMTFGLKKVLGVLTWVLGKAQVLLKGILWFAENGISGVKDVFYEKLNKISSKLIGWKNDVLSDLSGMWDFLMSPIQWILDKIEELKNIDLGSLVPDIGDITGGLASLNPFASGGVSSGPSSGYAVALHGTEAVVPLPDGRSIPVTMQGGGGGGEFTANITINGAGGDASAIARAVGQEVQRAFRSRSRSGGYGRGV
jgi:hypothetical protein